MSESYKEALVGRLTAELILRTYLDALSAKEIAKVAVDTLYPVIVADTRHQAASDILSIRAPAYRDKHMISLFREGVMAAGRVVRESK